MLGHTFTVAPLWKELLREWKGKPWTGKRCLEDIYLLKDLHPKYGKDSKLNNKEANNAILGKVGKSFE